MEEVSKPFGFVNCNGNCSLKLETSLGKQNIELICTEIKLVQTA